MANTTPRTPGRRATARVTNHQPWMSERQLEAYLETRDALRRVRSLASLAPEPRRDVASPASRA
ncbi:MAG: hypothetical protein ABJD97_11190 [Betaproteobacteria bacterium]